MTSDGRRHTDDLIREHLERDVPEVMGNLQALNRATWGMSNYPQDDNHDKMLPLVDLSRQLCFASRLAMIIGAGLLGGQGLIWWVLWSIGKVHP